MHKINVASHTIFMPFNTAWTFSGLETAFCSVFPLSNASIGVNGDETGCSSEESASSFLELEMPWKDDRSSKLWLQNKWGKKELMQDKIIQPLLATNLNILYQ